ncbi:MAG: N-acetyltransferase [Acidobacteria bacterium]|nr:N-acetyltransferase [Acidobacteriota bacterium]
MTEIRKGRYLVTTDRSRLNIDAIHAFLSREAYWSEGLPLVTLKRSIENSLCFGLFEEDQQIGFARVISDLATVAYLGDVYIADSHREQGLSRLLLDAVFSHPDLQNLRRWILLTSSADWLYRKYGFEKLPRPEIYMERFDPDVYTRFEQGAIEV